MLKSLPIRKFTDDFITKTKQELSVNVYIIIRIPFILSVILKSILLSFLNVNVKVFVICVYSKACGIL